MGERGVAVIMLPLLAGTSHLPWRLRNRSARHDGHGSEDHDQRRRCNVTERPKITLSL